jgi:hypothetical protein
MIRKSGSRFSDNIVLKPRPECLGPNAEFGPASRHRAGSQRRPLAKVRTGSRAAAVMGDDVAAKKAKARAETRAFPSPR